MHDTGITYRKGLYDKIKTKQFVTVSVIRPSGMSVSDNIGSPSIQATVRDTVMHACLPVRRGSTSSLILALCYLVGCLLTSLCKHLESEFKKKLLHKIIQFTNNIIHVTIITQYFTFKINDGKLGFEGSSICHVAHSSPIQSFI